jgi:hypothetical protein
MSDYAMTAVNGVDARQLDRHRLEDGTNAAVFAIPGAGSGLIMVGTDLFEYISPSAALIEWFRWLFGDDEESAKPSLIWRNYL